MQRRFKGNQGRVKGVSESNAQRPLSFHQGAEQAAFGLRPLTPHPPRTRAPPSPACSSRGPGENQPVLLPLTGTSAPFPRGGRFRAVGAVGTSSCPSSVIGVLDTQALGGGVPQSLACSPGSHLSCGECHTAPSLASGQGPQGLMNSPANPSANGTPVTFWYIVRSHIFAQERDVSVDQCLSPSHSAPGGSHALKPSSSSCGKVSGV